MASSWWSTPSPNVTEHGLPRPARSLRRGRARDGPREPHSSRRRSDARRAGNRQDRNGVAGRLPPGTAPTCCLVSGLPRRLTRLHPSDPRLRRATERRESSTASSAPSGSWWSDGRAALRAAGRIAGASTTPGIRTFARCPHVQNSRRWTWPSSAFRFDTATSFSPSGAGPERCKSRLRPSGTRRVDVFHHAIRGRLGRSGDHSGEHGARWTRIATRLGELLAARSSSAATTRSRSVSCGRTRVGEPVALAAPRRPRRSRSAGNGILTGAPFRRAVEGVLDASEIRARPAVAACVQRRNVEQPREMGFDVLSGDELGSSLPLTTRRACGRASGGGTGQWWAFRTVSTRVHHNRTAGGGRAAPARGARVRPACASAASTWWSSRRRTTTRVRAPRSWRRTSRV